jgi:4-amino-4-deoxy-L-arabinose transferase-like glycosyltransferase
MPQPPARRQLALLFGAVFLAKILILFILIPAFKGTYPYMNVDVFPDHYDKLAVNLAAGEGYRFAAETAPTMARTPGYPLLLALVFVVFGHSLLAAKALNMLLVFAGGWLLAGLTRKLARPPWPAVAALIFILHPAVILAETRGGPEILLTFTVVLFIRLLYRAIDRDRPGDSLLAGLALGVSTLVKSTTLLFPLAWLVHPLLHRRTWDPATPERSRWLTRRLSKTLVMVAGLGVVLVPWIVRNHAVSGRFVPTMTVVGMSANQGLHIARNASLTNPLKPNTHSGRGMNDGAYEAVRMAEEQGYAFTGDYFLFFDSSRDEVDFNAFLLKHVVETYRRDPALLAKCLLVSAFNFWFAGVTVLATIFNLVIQLPLLILAAMGLRACIRTGRWRVVSPLVLFIAYYVAVHLPILAIARHSIPLIPLLAALAACAGERMIRLPLAGQASP